MKVLALSSSRSADSAYLEPALDRITNLLGNKPLQIAFVPFASVNTYDKYLERVNKGLETLPYNINLITGDNGKELLNDCDCILVGGGSTFKLLHDLYKFDLLNSIRGKVLAGIPYIGWSAGTNILGPSIKTTNDMPIIQPESFKALNIFPFQINPHYFNQEIDGFHGETRDQRLLEYLTMNQDSTVIALPEGCALIAGDDGIVYSGDAPGYRFYWDGEMKKEPITNGQAVG